jgi:hypothetical protein
MHAPIDERWYLRRTERKTDSDSVADAGMAAQSTVSVAY